MTNSELIVLKGKLEILESHLKDINRDMEKMRSYFKYQCEDTDSASEDAIVAWQDLNTYSIKHIIELLDEISEWNAL